MHLNPSPPSQNFVAKPLPVNIGRAPTIIFKSWHPCVSIPQGKTFCAQFYQDQNDQNDQSEFIVRDVSSVKNARSFGMINIYNDPTQLSRPSSQPLGRHQPDICHFTAETSWHSGRTGGFSLLKPINPYNFGSMRPTPANYTPNCSKFISECAWTSSTILQAFEMCRNSTQYEINLSKCKTIVLWSI